MLSWLSVSYIGSFSFISIILSARTPRVGTLLHGFGQLYLRWFAVVASERAADRCDQLEQETLFNVRLFDANQGLGGQAEDGAVHYGYNLQANLVMCC